jgi:aminopeptidase N
MENIGFVRIGRSFINSPSQAIESLVAHEVAHEWFYAAVGNNQYEEGWLDEGFASFATVLFIRERDSDWEQPSPATPVIINRSLKHYIDNGLGVSPMYSGGRAFLWSLMEEMGEGDFFAMIRFYYESYKGKEAKTGDFIEILNEWTNNGAEAEGIIKSYIR